MAWPAGGRRPVFIVSQTNGVAKNKGGFPKCGERSNLREDMVVAKRSKTK